ncbi:TPA: hypothetical protein R1915_000953 [Staphylococcus delphini]|nr:hypothetical protein [Staphylococcus delphini]
MIEEHFKSRVFLFTQSIVSGLTPLSYVLFGLLVPFHYGIVYVVCAVLAFISCCFLEKVTDMNKAMTPSIVIESIIAEFYDSIHYIS